MRVRVLLTSCSMFLLASGEETYQANIYNGSNTGLIEIPDDIPNQSTEVYLDNNIISEIRNNSFELLSMCTRLSLSENSISLIEHDAFNGLIGLQHLNLDHNQISVLEPGVSRELTNLQELYLSHNLLTNLQPGTFKNLRILRDLWLQYNKLPELNSDMFYGLDSMETLLVQTNQFSRLSSDVFKYFSRPLILGLGDPSTNLDPKYRCDADLCWLKLEELDQTVEWSTYLGEDLKPECADGLDWDSFQCTSDNGETSESDTVLIVSITVPLAILAVAAAVGGVILWRKCKNRAKGKGNEAEQPRRPQGQHQGQQQGQHQGQYPVHFIGQQQGQHQGQQEGQGQQQGPHEGENESVCEGRVGVRDYDATDPIQDRPLPTLPGYEVPAPGGHFYHSIPYAN